MHIVIFLLLLGLAACGSNIEPQEPEPTTRCKDGTYEGDRVCEVDGLVCYEGFCRYPCDPRIYDSCVEYPPHNCEERWDEKRQRARHFCEIPEGR